MCARRCNQQLKKLTEMKRAGQLTEEQYEEYFAGIASKLLRMLKQGFVSRHVPPHILELLGNVADCDQEELLRNLSSMLE